MFKAPTSTAPAVSRREIKVASRVAGTRSRLILEPARVDIPAMSNKFLTANGTPASGKAARAFAGALSIAAALATARSPSTAVNAFSAGLRWPILTKAAVTISLALARPSRTAAAISLACAHAVSISAGLGGEDGCRLGLIRQREVHEGSGKPQRGHEVRLDRRFPGRLDRETEHMRRRHDEIALL